MRPRRKGKMLDTTALALHSNKPSPRQRPTTTNKQKSQTRSIITPYCGQGLKSAIRIQGKQKSFAYCTQNTVYGGLKSKNHFMDHIAGNILALTDASFSVYSFSMCCALVWELEEDGRLFSRCHFLSQCTWVIFKPFKKNISWYRYRTLQKENVKEAMLCSW